MSDSICIGKVVNTHSLKGDLKVQVYSNNIDRFENLDIVYFDKELKNFYEIERVKYHKNNVLLKLKGFDDINDVEKFKNNFIYIDKYEQGIELEEDEYYIEDLIGMQVFDENKGNIGKITDVIQREYQDLLEVNKSIYIPYVDEFIMVVDLENKIVKVKLIEGMLEL